MIPIAGGSKPFSEDDAAPSKEKSAEQTGNVTYSIPGGTGDSGVGGHRAKI